MMKIIEKITSAPVTRSRVLNEIWASEAGGVRLIPFVSEQDTKLKESARGILSEKLGWVKSWDKLPKEIKDFEISQAERGMKYSKAKGVPEALLEEIIKEAEELDDESILRGCLADMTADLGEAINPNWITFVQGEEDEMDGEEGASFLAKSPIDAEVPEPWEAAPKWKDEPTPHLAKWVKLDTYNWDQLTMWRKMRWEHFESIISEQNALFQSSLYTGGKMTGWRRKLLVKVQALTRKIWSLRDESFNQRFLDVVLPPDRKYAIWKTVVTSPMGPIQPTKVFMGWNEPSRLRRERYLKCGKELVRQAFDRSRKLDKEQAEYLVARNEALAQVIMEEKTEFSFETFTSWMIRLVMVKLKDAGGDENKTAKALHWHLTKLQAWKKKIIERQPMPFDYKTAERMRILINLQPQVEKLIFFREMFRNAKKVKDFDMRSWAFNKGLKVKLDLDLQVNKLGITKEEIEELVSFVESERE